MSDEKKEPKPLSASDAVYVDEDGNEHSKTAQLSKSGGSSDDEE
jgi:hypothetical protein